MKHIWKIITASALLGVGCAAYYQFISTTSKATMKAEQKAPGGHFESNSRIDVGVDDVDQNLSGRVLIPEPYRFSEGAAPNKFKDTDELKNSYGGSDRMLLNEFYNNFSSNVIEFNRPEQYEWLVKHGYPLPDDVIAAYKMSTDDLGKLVEQGNIKASYFYLMREVISKDGNYITDQMKQSGADGRWVQRKVAAEQAILKSGSPFIGYLWGAKDYENGKNPEALYAGYALAEVMGDRRAINQLSNNVPDFSARAFISALTNYMAIIRSKNPTAFSGRVDEFPNEYTLSVRY